MDDSTVARRQSDPRTSVGRCADKQYGYGKRGTKLTENGKIRHTRSSLKLDRQFCRRKWKN
jgi:hypothetical protein